MFEIFINKLILSNYKPPSLIKVGFFYLNNISYICIMISEKLKSVIFDKLYQDLKHCEIIPYDGSIYIIARDNKFWYFEYDKGGTLWWRYDFFNTFFELFSLTYKQFQSILGEWVEEVFNCKVLTTICRSGYSTLMVEEVLNCKVLTTENLMIELETRVEEVLNCKVLTTMTTKLISLTRVEEVLNCKVLTTIAMKFSSKDKVEEVLNCKVLTTNSTRVLANMVVEEILNYKVLTTATIRYRRPSVLEEVLNCNETKT